MSKIKNLDYAALNLSGDNYLQWALDTKITLKSEGLGECITENNKANEKEKFKAISIIRHHLTEGLKDQYLTMENPLDLWTALQRRYDHHKTVLKPKAEYDWKNLRFQDFKSVDEYNSALFKIVSKLKLCGEEITEKDLLEKTFSTFHSSNVLLQQQYRERGFTTFTDLISVLLLAEANNELLMRNSQMRPLGSAPVPEANEAVKEDDANESNYVHNDRHHGRGRGWKGRGGRGRNNNHGRGNHNNRGSGYHTHSGRGRGRGSGRGITKPPHSNKSVCHRCGMGNHWAKTCRTPKHFVDLYQQSQKGKNPEAHLVEDGNGDFDHENDDLMDYETSDCLKD